MLWTALALPALSAAVGALILLRRWQGEDVSLLLRTLGHGVPVVAGLLPVLLGSLAASRN